MGVQLKKLSEQTIVITGASSGIGLVTARMAARRGARLVLAARAEDALRRLTEEIKAAGGEAIHVVADVGNEQDVNRISVAAKQRFGGFDAWINNAGVSIYGNLLDVSNEDHRKLFETNFWGVVYGSQVAARHLRGRGGAIINVGSTLSDRAIPVQGMYSASKHAVKGLTDALRMELEAEGAPVSVTLIKPAGIDTPYTQHAKNYMESEPTVPPPVYAPETVADAILHCCENPVRDMFVGAGGKAISASGMYAPRLTDKVMEATMTRMQRTGKLPRADREGGLYKASGELAERGAYDGHVAETSAYTKATMHPFLTAALCVGAGLALAALLRPQLTGAGGRAGSRTNATGGDAGSAPERLNSSERTEAVGVRARSASA
jgi:short-subunit dehydrogenase